MSDADHSAEDGAASEPQTASSYVAKMSTNEQLIAVGALLILIVSDFFGDVLLDDYSVSSKLYLAATAAVALIFVVKLRGGSTPVSYTWLLRSAGLLVTIFGIREFLGDVEASNYLGSSNIIYALALYAGTALVAYGAYQLRD